MEVDTIRATSGEDAAIIAAREYLIAIDPTTAS
jgi:hypothetical protein